MTENAIRKLQSDPLLFSTKILGTNPWGKQREIKNSVYKNQRTAVRSCHGIGKTFISADVVLSFLYQHKNSIVLTTAPTWRQVEKQLWKEIRALHRNAKYPLGGNLMPKSPELQIIQDEWYAAGLSTDTPDRFQGFHEEHILIVVDEAAGINEQIFEAVEGILTSEGARLLLLGNPTSIGGTFYNSFKDVNFYKIAISAFDTPNFTTFGINIDDIRNDTWEEKIGDKRLPYPKLITPMWVSGRYKSWGENSLAWKTRVMGEFPEQGDDTLIPLSWVELAMERWKDMRAGDSVSIGGDIARFGSDRTVVTVCRGSKVISLKSFTQKSTTESAGIIMMTAREHNTKMVRVDEIGVGSGVVDILHDKGYQNVGVNVANKAKDSERFSNLRSEMWYYLRDRLDPDIVRNPDPIGLPPDEDLLMEISSVKYKINSKGQIQVEAKEEMKKRLGRSPDKADSVILAIYTPPSQPWVASGGGLRIDSLNW